jgi:hypothetical protein
VRRGLEPGERGRSLGKWRDDGWLLASQEGGRQNIKEESPTTVVFIGQSSTALLECPSHRLTLLLILKMTEKRSLERIEKLDTNAASEDVNHFHEEKGIKLDYSGAHEKISPEEIRLVKKLDLWIMVSLVPLKDVYRGTNS